MEFVFSGDIWYWRGPSPFHFVTVPEEHSEAIKAISPYLTYGYGMIPAVVRTGATEWKTSLWPKEGRYIVPIKFVVLKTENLKEGDTVELRLEVGAR